MVFLTFVALLCLVSFVVWVVTANPTLKTIALALFTASAAALLVLSGGHNPIKTGR